MCFEPRLDKRALPFLHHSIGWKPSYTASPAKEARKSLLGEAANFNVRVKNKKEFLLNQSNILVREYTLLLLLFVHFIFLFH